MCVIESEKRRGEERRGEERRGREEARGKCVTDKDHPEQGSHGTVDREFFTVKKNSRLSINAVNFTTLNSIRERFNSRKLFNTKYYYVKKLNAKISQSTVCSGCGI